MYIKRIIFVFISLLIILNPAFGVVDSNSLFTHITSSQGLSQNHVKSILQDNYGYMWFGTKNGLNRYDGCSMKSLYCYDYESSFGDQNISALYEDYNHNVWVGTDQGVFCYNRTTGTFQYLDAATSDGIKIQSWILDIVGDNEGNIWINMPDMGIFRYKEGILKLYSFSLTNPKNEYPSSFLLDSDGSFWIGTVSRGLFRYDKKVDSFVPIQIDGLDSFFSTRGIVDMCRYQDRIILLTNDGFILSYDTRSNEIKNINYNKTKDFTSTCIACLDNELLLGTNKGIFIVTLPLKTICHLENVLTNPYSLTDNKINEIFVDKDKGVWVGTTYGGVNYLPMHSLRFDYLLPGNQTFPYGMQCVSNFMIDNDCLWIATESAEESYLYNIVTHNVKKVKETGALIEFYNLKNKVVCSNKQNQLVVFDKITQSHQYIPLHSIGIALGSAYSFLVDKAQTQWIGSTTGLYCDSNHDGFFERIEAFSYDWIFDIYEEANGDIWFATMGNGVRRIDAKTKEIHLYEHNPADNHSLASNSTSSIFQDSQGRIWISTDRGGISLYNKSADNFINYSVKDGFPDDVAYKILEDDRHNLWFGTNRGLVCFNPETRGTKIYTTEDGLLSNQFYYKSAIKGNDGKFYFGCLGGVISFDPTMLKEEELNVPITFSKFLLYNKEITVHSPNSPLTTCLEETKKVDLEYDQSNISFNVSLMNFSSSKANQYYYRLFPVDNEWSKANRGEAISYAQLPPGQYKLCVRTDLKNNSGGSERSIQIVIKAPWWKTNYAYIIYFIIFSICVFMSYYYANRRRINKMIEEQKLLEARQQKEIYETKLNFFTEIAHEIRTPLTLINGPLEMIFEMNLQNKPLSNCLHAIEKNTNRLLDLVNQLLDFHRLGLYKLNLQPEAVNLIELIQNIVARFEPTIMHSKKRLITDLGSVSMFMVKIDREVITKIISNLLNNGLKYADTFIKIELVTDDNYFTMRVISDGDKIPADESEEIFTPFYRRREQRESFVQGVGIGLSFSRSLATAHHGSLWLDTDYENNCFTLRVPIQNEEECDVKNSSSLMRTDTMLVDQVNLLSDKADKKSAYCILLVEDNDEMRDFLKSRLEEYFTVIDFSLATQALTYLEDHRVDLILSDVMMPEMDGFEFCKIVKNNIDFSHIPVVFLTAKNDIASKIAGLKVGAEAYVEKPFAFEFLKNQIISLLNNRKREKESFAKRPFFPVGDMQMNQADQEFTNRVIQLIQENMEDANFNVEKMASMLCMSRSSLLRKIKTLFNMSPLDFIRLIKLKKAAELISEGKYLIGDICLMVGISSPSYFTKLFIKQFGVTPKEFEQESHYKQHKMDKK